ncbi:MAG: hypothetical protein LBU48_07740 [Coriobacteriales bacterium]|nr:hypothetical protein [Coriobacteriales bacterium]
MAKIENEYVRQVTQARAQVARAKSDYNAAVATAKKEVKAAQEVYDKRVKALKSERAKLEKDFAEQLKSYAGIKLYNDRIESNGRSLKFEYDIQADEKIVGETPETKELLVTFTSGEATLQAQGDPNKEELARDFISAVLSAKAAYPEKLNQQNARLDFLKGELDTAMNATGPVRAAEQRLDAATAHTAAITLAESELHRIEISGSPADKAFLREAESSKRKTTVIIVASAIIVILVVVLVVFLLQMRS